MQISPEGIIGIALGLIGLLGMGLMQILPTRLWIGWSLVIFSVAGIVSLGAYCFPADKTAKFLASVKYVFTPTQAKPVAAAKAPIAILPHPVASGEFRVVVGSFLNKEEAQAKANAINQESPSIKAFVAGPPPCNDYFAVVAGAFASRAGATKALGDIAKLKTVQGKPYISTRSNSECAKPSFPCTGNLKPDEWTICRDDHLAELDQIQSDSFTDFRSPSKHEIGWRILNARGTCETNRLCILDQQLFAIATFSGDGIDFPSWTGDYRLRLYKELLDELDTLPPQCTLTPISKISSDEIEFADGSHEVVPPDTGPIVASREKDMVLICLVSTQKKCPLLVFGKKVYSATNLRTNDTWVLPDTNATCQIE